ncbi:MAG: hypothetical protein LUE20_04480 [Oscillospiraceae bacterium]|nr:hypothetical protein [Oscillospiraceae bacterium]
MGGFKLKLNEGISEVRETGREAIELGSEMNEQADEINAILESIELQDSEDIESVTETGSEYQRSFDEGFSEQVEDSKGREISEKSRDVSQTASGELGNVRSGISSLERASHVSEIGREAAETGSHKLETSAGEYEDIISDVEGISREDLQEIENLKNSLSRIFG